MVRVVLVLAAPALVATLACCSSGGKANNSATPASTNGAASVTTPATAATSGDPLYDRWAAALTAAGIPTQSGSGVGSSPKERFESDKDLCATMRNGTYDAWVLGYTYGLSPGSNSRNAEEGRRAAAMVPVLCPDQQALIDEAKTPNPKMMVFPGGKAFIGNGYSPVNGTIMVQPGTYKTGPVSDCYWERLDGQGNIIENNMVSISQSVVVTIEPTDGAFVSKKCGRWTRVD